MNVSENLPVILIFAEIVNILLLYLVINMATKATQRAKYDWAQVELLSKIARAQGVAEEDVKAIFAAIK